MCTEDRPEDPRDAVAHTDTALSGVCLMLNQQPLGETIEAHAVAAVLGVIRDRLAPAVTQLQAYVSPDWTPAQGA